jgi:hypothetical protein
MARGSRPAVPYALPQPQEVGLRGGRVRRRCGARAPGDSDRRFGRADIRVAVLRVLRLRPDRGRDQFPA